MPAEAAEIPLRLSKYLRDGSYTKKGLEAVYNWWRVGGMRKGRFQDLRTECTDYGNIPPENIYIAVLTGRFHEHYILKGDPLGEDYDLMGIVSMDRGVPDDFSGAEQIIEGHPKDPQAQFDDWIKEDIASFSVKDRFSEADYVMRVGFLVRVVIGTNKDVRGRELGKEYYLLLRRRHQGGV